jgi:tetratricopeptide (TPR) repeat protein
MNRSASPLFALLLGPLALGACSLFSGDAPERRPAETVPAPVSTAGTASAATAAAPAAPGTAALPATPQTPVPGPAQDRYETALLLMKSGRTGEAEAAFKQLADAYPQLAGPQVNLGLIYLHDARLPEAETAFRSALKINPGNAVAGNGLGIAQRRQGHFSDAEAAYQQVIDADPNYAPAHLNLGVLYDLYLAQPQKALDEFERYLAITGENKQVAGWVIELKKRVGAPPAKKEPA